jgi:hypothetical protein
MMKRFAAFLFAPAVAFSFMLALLTVVLFGASAMADDNPDTPPVYGPCSDTACSGPSECNGDNVCGRADCYGCSFAQATDYPPGYEVCACDLVGTE